MPSETALFLEQLRRPQPVYTCARLKNGRVIRFPKDCGCATHDGPHWLHMDRTSRAINVRRVLDRGANLDMLTLMGFGQEERARLSELGFQMRRHQVEQMFTDDDALVLQAAGEAVAA